MNKHLTRFSKFISLVLRHQPQRYGLHLDEHGWAQIDDLVAVANHAGVPLTRDVLLQVVADNDKQRFAISDDGRSIRARQGHSINPRRCCYDASASASIASPPRWLLAQSRALFPVVFPLTVNGFGKKSGLRAR
jgi:RNA:NAD 2'-phosphotransferase (TPT1/KptA family)